MQKIIDHIHSEYFKRSVNEIKYISKFLLFRSKWSTIFSKNRMKIICTGFVLVSIMAGSMAFIISSKSSLNNERLDENDSGKIKKFENPFHSQKIFAS